jgi:hypothetical protein
MIFLGILIGLILGLPVGFIKWKKKPVVVEKYTRRGILQKEFSSTDNSTGKVSPIHVQYEIGELESTDKLSKIEVISFTPANSEYHTDYYKRKLTELIDKSWIDSKEVNWITTAADVRNKKINEILN